MVAAVLCSVAPAAYQRAEAGGGCFSNAGDKVRKKFFSEEQNQKTFPLGAQSVAGGTHQTGKSFLVLFFKKELLPFLHFLKR